MMKFEVTENNRFLELVHCDDVLEERQLEISFERAVANAHFKKNSKRYKGHWDGNIKFFREVGGKYFIPIGLWNEVFAMGKDHNIQIEIAGMDRLIDSGIEYKEFEKYQLEFFSDCFVEDEKGEQVKITPYDYQIMSAFNIVKYKVALSEIGTSGGKTLISFMVFAWLYSRKECERFLMIVPKEGLIIQGEEDWEVYGIHKLGNFDIGKVYGGAKKSTKECPVVFGTYQSLVKRDAEFLSSFDVVCVDEAHQTNTISIKNILGKCHGSKIRFGHTGTFPDKRNADHFTIQMYIGPIVNNISPRFLTDEGYATPVMIKVVRMDYASNDTKRKLRDLKKNSKDFDPSYLYNIEKKLVIENESRLKFICDFIDKTTKNSLVLFQSVGEGYGREIYHRLRDMNADKEVFYVDGGTSYDLRKIYQKKMEEGTNKILVATFGTFSTGISIKNLHNIFFVESYKSEIIIKQSLGRGMRKHGTKDTVTVIDFVDDFTWERKQNYLMNHSDARIKIYKRDKYDYRIYNVQF